MNKEIRFYCFCIGMGFIGLGFNNSVLEIVSGTALFIFSFASLMCMGCK